MLRTLILHKWHSSLPSKPSKPGFEGADPCPFLGSVAAVGIQLSPVRIGISTGASRKIATRVAMPARLRAMAARERHVGRIVGRAGRGPSAWRLRATGRGHLAHKGRTDALHVCSGWRRIWLPDGHDNSTSVFGCPRLWGAIIDYLRTKRPRSRNEHPTNCGRSQLHS
jgi:hypothetical protein